MAINVTSTLHRSVEDQITDVRQMHDNLFNEAHKDWPNDAGFEGLQEHRGPLDLTIKGTIPAWCAGALYRTGPGLSSINGTSMGTHYVSHWFDGFAQAHKFDIIPPSKESGATTVVYSSRRQSDDFVEHIKKEGWRASTSFGQRADPCVGLFAKVMSYFQPRQLNNNVVVHRNVPGLADKARPDAGQRTDTSNVYIGTDNFSLQEIDADTMEPLGFTNQSRLHPELKGPLSCAHAERDPETGDLFNFNLEPGRKSTYRFFRVNADTGTTDILATISEPELKPAYIHSFFLTEHYVILCVPSSHFAWNGLKILWKRNLLDAIVPFDEANLSQWIVVDRRHGKGVVARFSTPASFFFHSINAFEEQVHDENDKKQTDICMDYVQYENTDVMSGLYYDVLLDRNDATKKHYLQNERYKKASPRMVRYKFRMPSSGQTARDAQNAVAEEVISIPGPHAGELPTINRDRAGKTYRYVYSASNRGLSTLMDAIVKTDVETQEAVLWNGPVGHSPGEPVFIGRPGGTDEDDGVLLTVMLDGSAQKSYLLCLDAKTMMEVGRAEVEFAIGMGFHGTHAMAVE